MSSTAFDTRRASAAPDVIAPDGSEVRVLCATARGSMAMFSLMPGVISRAVAHRTIDEVWYFIRGVGQMWRLAEGREEITQIAAGISLSIPLGTHFQFRNDGSEPLEAVAVAMPPWPGDDEAYPVAGKWAPTV